MNTKQLIFPLVRVLIKSPYSGGFVVWINVFTDFHYYTLYSLVLLIDLSDFHNPERVFEQKNSNLSILKK